MCHKWERTNKHSRKPGDSFNWKCLNCGMVKSECGPYREYYFEGDSAVSHAPPCVNPKIKAE